MVFVDPLGSLVSSDSLEEVASRLIASRHVNHVGYLNIDFGFPTASQSAKDWDLHFDQCYVRRIKDDS